MLLLTFLKSEFVTFSEYLPSYPDMFRQDLACVPCLHFFFFLSRKNSNVRKKIPHQHLHSRFLLQLGLLS